MRARVLALLVLAGLGLGATGCVSLRRTPEARFFVLRPLAPPSAEAAGEVPATLVGVLPVRMPGYVDRPQLVTWTAPGELRIDEFLRWAEPLDAAATRTVAENLDALLPGSRVLRSPWPATAHPRCRVWVELTLFGLQAGGEVRLEGRWALLPARDPHPLATRPVSLHRGPFAGAEGQAPDASVGVEAMSALLADLSREIADAVRALPPEGPSESP
jgi:uncharacterized lipoprotein YmbA